MQQHGSGKQTLEQQGAESQGKQSFEQPCMKSFRCVLHSADVDNAEYGEMLLLHYALACPVQQVHTAV